MAEPCTRSYREEPERSGRDEDSAWSPAGPCPPPPGARGARRPRAGSARRAEPGRRNRGGKREEPQGRGAPGIPPLTPGIRAAAPGPSVAAIGGYPGRRPPPPRGPARPNATSVCPPPPPPALSPAPARGPALTVGDVPPHLVLGDHQVLGDGQLGRLLLARHGRSRPRARRCRPPRRRRRAEETPGSASERARAEQERGLRAGHAGKPSPLPLGLQLPAVRAARPRGGLPLPAGSAALARDRTGSKAGSGARVRGGGSKGVALGAAGAARGRGGRCPAPRQPPAPGNPFLFAFGPHAPPRAVLLAGANPIPCLLLTPPLHISSHSPFYSKCIYSTFTNENQLPPWEWRDAPSAVKGPL